MLPKQKDEIRIFTPSPILGYGYDADEFAYGVVECGADAIIVDAGSTDLGPFNLGAGTTLYGYDSYVRGLTLILDACFHLKVKVYISSAGGGGSNQHVDDLKSIVSEIATQRNWTFEVASIKAEISRETIHRKLREGLVHPFRPVHALTHELVDDTMKIVAQMGAEPFLEAIQSYHDPDVIVAGRAYDPTPFAAFCLSRGVDLGVAWHAGKISGVRRLVCGTQRPIHARHGAESELRSHSCQPNATLYTPLGRCTHILREDSAQPAPGTGGLYYIWKGRDTNSSMMVKRPESVVPHLFPRPFIKSNSKASRC
ncbi:uncharacterized protein PV07_08010 [Cladophialophora immunda]|uniref:Acyclic terpene utilisation N-terminal domain-containing protein n=1 Tax=Cladophialophora immunda TaxID=569365 RepID=A0A0D2AT37_9EURO|nr:uncharacterized protein PV07_08010 [Cladophialophora immunda]KIW28337.1 hypothetical protein PV07_08010 [Cladophialophora immunda]